MKRVFKGKIVKRGKYIYVSFSKQTASKLGFKIGNVVNVKFNKKDKTIILRKIKSKKTLEIPG